MSRSVTTPTSRSLSQTGTTPTSRLLIVCAASIKLASGATTSGLFVITSLTRMVISSDLYVPDNTNPGAVEEDSLSPEDSLQIRNGFAYLARVASKDQVLWRRPERRISWHFLQCLVGPRMPICPSQTRRTLARAVL